MKVEQTQDNNRKKVIIGFAIPISILLAVNCIFWVTNLDLFLQSFFYKSSGGWYLKDFFLLKMLYKFASIPGLVVFWACIIGLLFCLLNQKFFKYKKYVFFIILLMIIGSGLVNCVLKDYWGRPRPREVIQFGGEYKYVKPWMFGPAGKNSSFPSGHALAAFFLIFPYFLFKNRRNKGALIFLFLGIIYGLLIGFTRMVQGGHFASDIIWSGGITYLIGLGLHYILKLDKAVPI